MPPVVMELILLILAGIFGALASAAALREYDFSTPGKILSGAIGGGIGGYLLLIAIPPMVTASGDPTMDDSPVNHAMIVGLVGLVCGGLLTLMIGFVKNETRKS